jgi:hypothetical protein
MLDTFFLYTLSTGSLKETACSIRQITTHTFYIFDSCFNYVSMSRLELYISRHTSYDYFLMNN